MLSSFKAFRRTGNEVAKRKRSGDSSFNYFYFYSRRFNAHNARFPGFIGLVGILTGASYLAEKNKRPPLIYWLSATRRDERNRRSHSHVDAMLL